MDPISIAFDVITMIITSYLCARNIKGLYKSSRYFIYYLVVIIYVIPLFLDYFVGFPVYNEARYKGFELSEYDTASRCLFDLVIIFIQIIILKYRNHSGKEGIITGQESNLKYDRFIDSSSIKRLLYLFMIGTVVSALVVLRRPDIVVTPLWREYLISSEIRNYATFERLSYVGMACSVVLLLTKNISFVGRITSLFFLYFNICIEGKKSGIIFVIMVGFILLLSRIARSENSIKKKKKMLIRYIVLGIILVYLIVRITIYVKTTSRGYIATDVTRLYTAFRIDVFRDDRVRMAIYSLLHSDNYQGIPFPGQTYLIAVFYLFPFDYIFGSMGVKRMLNMHTYSDYLSAALYGGTVESVAGFMTPAILAELIANFSVLGVVLFPFICIWFSSKTDKYEYPINIFIICSFFMLQMYSLSYIAYLLEFTFLLCISKRIRFVIRKKYRC